MNEEKVTLAEIQIDAEDLIKELGKIQEEMDGLRESQKELVKAGEKSSEQYQKQAVKLKELRKEYNDNQRLVTGLNTARKNEIMTVAEARKAVSALNVQWTKTTKLYGEQSEESQALTQRLEEMRGRLKELEGQAGSTSSNVGNYRKSIEEAIGGMGQFSPVANKVTGGIKQIGAALKALLMNPVVLAITAIITALTALVNAFKSTEQGAVKFNEVLEKVRATIDVLRNAFVDVGKTIVSVFKGDTTIKEAAAEIKASFSGIKEKIEEVTEAAGKYTQAINKLENSENNWISRQAEIRNAQAKARYTAEDRDADIRERRAATEEYISLLMEEVAQTKDFAKQRLDIETEKLASLAGVDKAELLAFVTMTDRQRENASSSLKETRNRYKEQVNELEKLYAAYIDADTQYYEKAKKSLSKRAELANQEREILKGRIEADREFYEALMETVNMDLLSISQKETAALNTLRIDEELTEQTREQAKARVEMAKWEAEQVRIAQEAKMMFMGDALGGMAELFGRETALGKSAAIAQATINAYLAGSQVLSDATLPTVAKVAGMVAVITSGMANVRNIMKVDTSGGSVGAVATGGGSVIGTAPTTTAALNNYAGIVTANTANSTAGASNIVGGISDTVNKRETVLVLEDYQLVESRANRIKVESTI